MDIKSKDETPSSTEPAEGMNIQSEEEIPPSTEPVERVKTESEDETPSSTEQAEEMEIKSRDETPSSTEAAEEMEIKSGDEMPSSTAPAEDEDNNRGNDVLYLNVGGTVVNVLRRTLCRGGRSLLASQFSGKQDETLIKDRDGNFFINQPFELFSILLRHLWARDSWSPRAAPIVPPALEDFAAKRDYHTFLNMVEYFEMTPVVYPTRILIHKGNPESSQIEQYPRCSVTASKLTTFVMQSQGHGRSIQSFRIKVGKVDDLRVGWAGDEFIILDFMKHKLHMRGGAIVDARPIELQDGSTILCERTPKGFQWELDGEIVSQYQTLPASTLIPAFKGKGSWHITDVVLAYS
eukprot:scaffold22660_cov127-Cylindrotheca_fusiformis.AAC.3